jgi:hypothetical protein
LSSLELITSFCKLLFSLGLGALFSLAQAQIPYQAIAGNNTSACSARGEPSYCKSGFPGNNTRASNSDAQTVVVNPPPGNVNFSDLHALLFAGSTSKIVFHYQPWFGNFEHIDVGYNSNQKSTVSNQIAKMMALGGYGVLVDWYGSTNHARSFFLDTTNVMAKYLSSCFSTTCPFHLGMMEDKGAFSAQCPKGKKDQTSCLIKNLIEDMDYINKHYATQPWYLTEGSNPIVLLFLHEPEWSGSDWNRVWSEVKSHTDSYERPFKFVFEEEDVNCWRHPYGDGCYVWMNPAKWSPQAQFNWGASSNSAPVYYHDFYKNAVAHPDKIAIGAIKKGFDDNNASWGTNRVTAQQCGRTLLNTADLISRYYNSGRQLEWLGVPTWNDYEEGSEVETGIDNCYTISASISGHRLTWELQPASSYATRTTVDHFTVYYADRNNLLYVGRDNIPANASSLDLDDLVPPGASNIYVRMVGKPLFINRISGAVLYSNRGR